MMSLYKQVKPRKTIQKKRRRQYARGRGNRDSTAVLYRRGLSRDLQTFFTLTNTLATTAAVQYFPLHIPTVGNSYNNRIGDKTLLKSCTVQFSVLPQSTETKINDVRCMLVWDQQPNKALPTSPMPLLEAKPYATKDPQLSERFIVLRECIVTTAQFWANTAGIVGTYNRSAPIKWYVKLNNSSKFNASTGAASDIETGSLLFCYVADTAALVQPNIVLAAETKYVS